MLVFFLCVCGLLYQSYFIDKQQALESNNLQFASRLMHLNAVIKQTEEDVQRMRRWATQYLEVSEESPTLTPLAARIKDSTENQFSLDNVALPHNQEFTGNIIGAGSFHNRPPRFYRLVNMTTSLFPLQHATHQHTPRILTSAFFSPEYQFGSIFPYISLTEYLEMSEDGTALGLRDRFLSIYKKDNFPEANPAFPGLWSEPRVGLKRLGIKVNYLTGLYDRDGFAGIIVANIGLEFLNQFMQPFAHAGGGLILTTYKDNILASSKTDHPSLAESVPSLNKLLPDAVIAELRKIYNPEEVEAHKILNHYFIVAPIADTRWTLMHILSEQELSTYLRPYQIRIGLILLGTLIFLGMGYFFINRKFIQPAIQARHELEHSRASFLNIVEKNNNGILVLDQQQNTLFSNQAARDLLGLGEDLTIYHDLDLPLTKEKHTIFEITHPTKEHRFLEIGATDTQWEGRHATLAMLQDVTQRKRAEALAYLDPLTGIPNRLLLKDRLTHGLKVSKRRGLPLAILYMDLDMFKGINDSLGHDAGDELLKLVSQRLTKRVRESDTIARLGGDEFIIIMEGITDKQVPKQLAQSIITAIATPFRVKGETLSISVSIGISIFPDDGDNPEDLMANADSSMYEVKHRGGNGMQCYCPEAITTDLF